MMPTFQTLNKPTKPTKPRKQTTQKKKSNVRKTIRIPKDVVKNWFDLKILVAMPTRNRPERALRALSLAMQHQMGTGVVHYHLLIDQDDEYLAEYKSLVDAFASEHVTLAISMNKEQTKITACNESVSSFKGDWDILLLLSDDFMCEYPSWDLRVREAYRLSALSREFDLDMVYFTNDGFTFPTLNTLPILGKTYYDRFGYVYHPSYKSWYCDNEMMMVSRRLVKEKMDRIVLFRHDHPFRTGAKTDPLYIKNDAYQYEDRKNFEHRQSVNFI